MLKQSITYTDYNGVERTEDFYFNLSKAELTEMHFSKLGGLDVVIQRIINTSDNPSLIKIFKELVLKAYGEKSDDGKQFLKIDPVTGRPLSEKFMQTEAYSVLFMLLSSNDEEAAKFINGIIPADIAKEIAKQEQKIN